MKTTIGVHESNDGVKEIRYIAGKVEYHRARRRGGWISLAVRLALLALVGYLIRLAFS